MHVRRARRCQVAAVHAEKMPPRRYRRGGVGYGRKADFGLIGAEWPALTQSGHRRGFTNKDAALLKKHLLE